jgi:iron(III) transport system ATP-binding protein
MDSRESDLRRGAARRGDEDWGRPNTAGVAIAASLSFDRVGHAYGDEPVLSDVSFTAGAGGILCLLGPSGSGKTTLLRIAAGIDQPLRGTVRIDERVVSGDGIHVPPERRGVGLVFQDFALFPHLTNLDNVAFGLRGMDRAEARRQATRMLERVGMARHGAAYPHQLSGGEQQRIALARALAPRPGVLLMDEPFSGLDARLRDNVRDETLRLLKETRATAIVVTHDPEEALKLGDRIVILRAGSVVQQGTGADLYRRPVDLFVAEFFSGLNRYCGRVEGGAARAPWFIGPAHGLAEGAAVDICVRYGDVVVKPADRGGGGKPGRILSRRFVGEVETLEILVSGCERPVHARLRAGRLPTGLVDVSVGVMPGAAMVFPAG